VRRRRERTRDGDLAGDEILILFRDAVKALLIGEQVQDNGWHLIERVHKDDRLSVMAIERKVCRGVAAISRREKSLSLPKDLVLTITFPWRSSGSMR
jgi:hypothetical protein